MRRMIAILLATVMLCTGCAGRKDVVPEGAGVYDLYFLEADLGSVPAGDALRTEEAVIEGAEKMSPRVLAVHLVQRLLEGPGDKTLRAVIPSRTSLLSLKLEGEQAVVDLSYPYGTLSDVLLTMADCAITLTLTQLPEINSVRITVRGEELEYRDKQVFTAEDVLFSSLEDVVDTTPAVLYFLDEEGDLVPEEQRVELYEGDSQVDAVFRALQNGSEQRQLSSPVPEEIQQRDIWTEGRICYVDLSSQGISRVNEPEKLIMFTRAVEKSLCSLETVEKVRFLVDGEPSNLFDPGI